MKTKKIISIALMSAIIIILASTPLGMIQLPIIKATTVHIPVIIGAVLFGPLVGGVLGAVFGICSLISNTITPSLLSFAFSPFAYFSSPFVKEPTFLGALGTIWISVGCRVMIGVISGWIWILFKKIKWNTNLRQIFSLSMTGFIGSMVNTATVMGSIYLLFAQQYAQAKEVTINAVWGLVMATVTTSGIPEAIAAAILVAAITKVLIKMRIE